MAVQQKSRQSHGAGEFGLGWRVLLASTVGIAFGAVPLPYAAMGHLIVPLNHEYGWSRSETQVAIIIYSLTLTLLAPFFGALIDRLGARSVAIVSTLLFGLSWMAISLTSGSLWLFYVLWLLCALLGGASAPVSWTRGVNAWFTKRRGLALSIALTGTGLAAIFFNLMLPLLIGWWGWRGAILVAALPALLISFPLALLNFRERRIERDNPSDADSAAPQVSISFADAIRRAKFWLMFVAFGLVGLAVGGLYVNLVPLLTDKGFSAAAAGSVVAAMGASIVVGRLMCGLLLDRIWAPTIAFTMFSIPVLGCVLLLYPSTGIGGATVAAILFGLASGAEIDIAAYMAVRHYGLSHYGRIYGLLYASFAIMSSTSAYIYGLSFDLFASYNPALVLAAVSLLTAGLFLLFTGRYPSSDVAGR